MALATQQPNGDDEPSTKPAHKRSIYEASTQYRHWRYSPEQLAQTRASLNAAAVSAIRITIEAESPGSSSNVTFLNADEERLLVKLYVSKITQLCGHFRFPEDVEATAASYLKRFYLKNTVMDWHPKNVMLTALFLATKTCNHPISLDEYTSHIPNTSPSDVLDLEFLIAQSLGFEFAVWHPHRALWGLWLDVQSLEDFPKEGITEIYDTALSHIRASRLTDAELIFAPSQIALACLALSSPTLAAAWARSKSSENVLPILESIQEMITRDGSPPNVEAVRDVDRRLKLCKNPEKVVGSKAYLAKKDQEEKAAAEKRARKAEEVRKTMEESDPFGEALTGKHGDEAVDVAGLDDDD
ncbi:hypothetical protein JAAARDRAFT_148424 [Jaapia argillacea MUCL 33604]|uniref:Cyclin-like domain-containing protein n=1 Tax=Jaapia argillacea MUCL 33604 TaxID=933084 RepID=A0A067Q9V7_9AGAM|nr:hypothetical protein JAAARDRAFT_148424 [Jaapia argillacea MUCL 33604]